MNYSKVIFIHIAKTGGTSIAEYFEQLLPPELTMSHGAFDISVDPPLSAEIVRGKQFISGHFGFDHVKDYLEDAYSFTILRDPLSRVMSFYRFCMHEDMQRQYAVARAARDLSINDFLRSQLPQVCEMLDNQQTWQIASMYRTQDRKNPNLSDEAELLALAKSNLAKLSYVGFTEAFKKSFKRIVADVGVEPPKKVPSKLRTQNPISPEEISPEVLEDLKGRLKLDYALYDFAKKHYWPGKKPG